MATQAPNAYLRKHGLYPPQIRTGPSQALGMVVVIPCHDEPDLTGTLECLWACERPGCDAEVVVVINGSVADGPAVRARNRACLDAAAGWIARHEDPTLQFHLLYFPDLPPRHAGVGLARKLGMDEAVGRLHAADNPEGIIIGLDADCRCQPNYLSAIHAHFAARPDTPGCAIHFEHPVEALTDPRARLGIVRYELFLRYYVHGLRYAGFPYAYHTVGSCMAVRSRVYEKRGGMNRRQAGEDFYFLHKIIPLGNFTELRTTTVIPAARDSRRVPFGTGRAMARWLEGEHHEYLVCSPRVFRDLIALFESLDTLYGLRPEAWPSLGLASALDGFLHTQGFTGRLTEIQRHTASPQTFRKRLFHWLDGLRILKYVHYATAHGTPRIPVEEAAISLLRWRGLLPEDRETLTDAEALLRHYRRLDRAGGAW